MIHLCHGSPAAAMLLSVAVFGLRLSAGGVDVHSGREERPISSARSRATEPMTSLVSSIGTRRLAMATWHRRCTWRRSLACSACRAPRSRDGVIRGPFRRKPTLRGVEPLRPSGTYV